MEYLRLLIKKIYTKPIYDFAGGKRIKKGEESPSSLEIDGILKAYFYALIFFFVTEILQFLLLTRLTLHHIRSFYIVLLLVSFILAIFVNVSFVGKSFWLEKRFIELIKNVLSITFTLFIVNSIYVLMILLELYIKGFPAFFKYFWLFFDYIFFSHFFINESGFDIRSSLLRKNKVIYYCISSVASAFILSSPIFLIFFIIETVKISDTLYYSLLLIYLLLILIFQTVLAIKDTIILNEFREAIKLLTKSLLYATVIFISLVVIYVMVVSI